MQGIVSSFAKSTTMGQLYAGVALVELAAGLTGYLAFAGLFDLGLGFNSITGLGLPFFVSTVSLPLLSASAKVGSTALKRLIASS